METEIGLMDNLNLLCDELIQEILQRLPLPSSSSSISLVCKRWLFLHHSSKTTLSIRFPPNYSNSNSSTSSSSVYFSSLLSRYPVLRGLTVVSGNVAPTDDDHRLLAVASNCRNLRHLRFLAGPFSTCALQSLACSCRHLTSLSISSFSPFSFRWLASFPSLKEVSVLDCRGCGSNPHVVFDEIDDVGFMELPLESLCLSGIGPGDLGMGWLWRNCTRLRKLKLSSCEGTGDGVTFSSFVRCLAGLRELELRACRSIVDGVLLRIAEHCTSLTSLLIYDGGSHDGLHWFLTQCRSTLRRLDLRLPLDLDDDHLTAIAENLRGLLSLRLQSCCLISGPGLKLLVPAMSAGLEELALINCDVVEREPGLLTSLGQSFWRLHKLDLSYNDMLLDKELGSMLASCKNLVDIRVRGCGGLTNAVIISMLQSCLLLESVDIMQCRGISPDDVELFVLNSPKLSRILVEENKLSDAARTWTARKVIQVG